MYSVHNVLYMCVILISSCMTVHAYVHSIHNGSVYDVVSKKPIVFYILGIHNVYLYMLALHTCLYQ